MRPDALPAALVPLARVLELALLRHLERSDLTGNVKVPALTADERLALAGLLGGHIPTLPGETLTLPLRQLDAALTRSGYPSIVDFGPWLGRSDAQTSRSRKAEAVAARASWRESLLQVAAALPGPGGQWLGQVAQGHGGAAALAEREYRLAARNGDKGPLHEDLLAVAMTLETLPSYHGRTERLQLVAEAKTGTPHGFDRDRRSGRLLRRALVDLIGQDAGVTMPPRSALEDATLLAAAGLTGDGISSSVALWGVVAARRHDGTHDPLVSAAHADNVPLLAPIRQVERWADVSLTAPSIYVVENPPVFEEILDRAGDLVTVPLLCGSGYLAAAATWVLDLAVAGGATIHYSGDFDVAGLSIARRLWRRYGSSFILWGMTPENYALAAANPQSEELDEAALATLQTFRDTPLASVATAMCSAKRIGYEEAISARLADSVLTRASSSACVPPGMPA